MSSFQTANLYEIALLLAVKKSFTKIDRNKSDDKVVFYFENSLDCQEILSAYYRKENLVSPFDFVTAIREAKQIIYNYAKK